MSDLRSRILLFEQLVYSFRYRITDDVDVFFTLVDIDTVETGTGITVFANFMGVPALVTKLALGEIMAPFFGMVKTTRALSLAKREKPTFLNIFSLQPTLQRLWQGSTEMLLL